MRICSDGHREIVYDDQEEDEKGILEICPLCELLQEMRIKSLLGR